MTSAGMVLVGQPDHRRTHLLQAALQRRGLPPARVIAYDALLANPQWLAAALTDRAAVKLDSPGESDALHDALLHRGWARTGASGAPPAPLAHGELAHQHLWYAGFADLLDALQRSAGDADWLNPPDDILRMCDKWRCQQALAAAGVAVPPLLGLIEGYDDLLDRMTATGCDRVFIKARYGSSAAGVVAYRRHRDGREIAYASTELVEDATGLRLFNTLTPQRFVDRKQIAALIDALARQGAYAERWIAKPRARGHTGHHFDLRVVAFEGAPRQRVARIAARPMTNLHLGNCRSDPQALLDEAGMEAVERCVRDASAAFPRSASIGLDLIPTRAGCRVLEANAFGDLLPGLQWRGCDAWDDQAAWTMRTARSHRHVA